MPPVPPMTLTFSRDAFFIKSSVKHECLFEKILLGNPAFKYYIVVYLSLPPFISVYVKTGLLIAIRKFLKQVIRRTSSRQSQPKTVAA